MQELALGAASSRDFLPVMSRWAALLSSYLVFSFEELAAADGAAIDTPRLKYNAAAVFDRGGALVATYRKQRTTAKERAAGFSEGSGGPVLIDADFARFSVLVCQDLFYPELWQVVRVRVRARTLFLALVRLRAPSFLEKTESRQRKPNTQPPDKAQMKKDPVCPESRLVVFIINPTPRKPGGNTALSVYAPCRRRTQPEPISWFGRRRLKGGAFCRRMHVSSPCPSFPQRPLACAYRRST